MAKLRVGLLFGGRSVEHEVSINSAHSIFRALDPERYEVHVVAVDHAGRWHLAPPARPPQSPIEGDEVRAPAVPGERALLPAAAGAVQPLAQLDILFPIVHGRGGEDGSLQGLLDLAELPYVGSGVLGSALQMDKEVSKRLLHAAALPVLPWISVRAPELEHDAAAVVRRASEEIGLPVFVKPANLGSSVGISRAADAEALAAGLREAARYDTKILVERAIPARDVEVALLGNEPVEASVVGEIRTRREFYDYEAKYVDEDTELLVPAPISDELSERLRALAIEAFQVLEGDGLARVDFVVDRNTEEFFVNEVNSLPGFTDVSMYPQLWQATGLPYPALLDRLIELGMERHHRRSVLETQYSRT
jgi:D-alanine-D-alanine ligase